MNGIGSFIARNRNRFIFEEIFNFGENDTALNRTARNVKVARTVYTYTILHAFRLTHTPVPNLKTPINFTMLIRPMLIPGHATIMVTDPFLYLRLLRRFNERDLNYRDIGLSREDARTIEVNTGMRFRNFHFLSSLCFCSRYFNVNESDVPGHDEV